MHCRSTFFFFNDTATTEIYTLSLHDALPICAGDDWGLQRAGVHHDTQNTRDRNTHGAGSEGLRCLAHGDSNGAAAGGDRSEEHTSELQSRLHLVCRLLLEKKKTNNIRMVASY